jgi:2-aminobenzoate-CoA ligase
MGKIPEEYLPPQEYRPQKICLLPELNYPEKLNLAEVLLDQNVEKRGDKVAIYFKDQRITYSELQGFVNRFANALRELGVGKDDRVMLRSPNIPEYLIWNFACWRIGAIPVLVNHMNRHEEVAFKANDSEAVAICVHSAWYEDVAKIRSSCPKLKHVIVVGDRILNTLPYEDLIKKQPERTETEDTSRDDIGRIIYSSGTTGKPKGIIGSNGDLLSATDTHGRYTLGIREEDILGGHPYFTFAFGSVNYTLHPWRFGASVSVMERFKAEDMFELIQKHKITLLFAVPTAFRMMLSIEHVEKKYDCTSLRLCQSAGEWLPGVTFSEFKKRFGVEILDSLGSGDLNYWLSTTSGVHEEKVGSTGTDIPGIKNTIVDEHFKEVPPGTLGELLVLSPTGQQYWRRPDKQKEGVVWQDCEFKGWNRPGLLFVKDGDGFFWYKSRSDDMIVTAGYKIPGGEVEAALNEHPAVLESAVVDSPDKDRGTLVKAFVVLREGVQPSEDLIKGIQEHVKSRIEIYKYPRIIEFAKAEDLPRTGTGKIQRNVLREMEKKKTGMP